MKKFIIFRTDRLGDFLIITNIIKAIKYALNPINKMKIKNVINPYGEGGASKKIIDILKLKNLNNLILKDFFNIKFK